MCAMVAQSCGSRLAAPRELSGAASAVRKARHWPTSSCSVPAQRNKRTIRRVIRTLNATMHCQEDALLARELVQVPDLCEESHPLHILLPRATGIIAACKDAYHAPALRAT